MYKEHLVLNNLQELICHPHRTNQNRILKSVFIKSFGRVKETFKLI